MLSPPSRDPLIADVARGVGINKHHIRNVKYEISAGTILDLGRSSGLRALTPRAAHRVGPQKGATLAGFAEKPD